MLAEAIVSSALIAKVRGGKFSNFEKLEVRAWYLLVLSAMLQGFSNLLVKNNISILSSFVQTHYFYIHISSYILIFVVLGLNLNIKSMRLLLIGSFLNFAVISANNGAMPVLLAETVEDRFKVMDLGHSIMNQVTKLWYLGDIIPIPRPYPLPKIISIGDIFIVIGVFIFVQQVMVNKKLRPQ